MKEDESPPKDGRLLYSGHTACAGCGMMVALRHILAAAGRNTIISNATSCSEITTSKYPKTAWGVPYIHVAFECTAAVASGVEAALKKQNKQDTNVICIAGDGGTFDIGLQALSGMVERGHNVLYICYDNECYANCLSRSTLILTKSGLRKITEVKEGDEVYAFDLRRHNLVLKKCTGVFDNGEKETFEVDTMHHSIKTTANHPFLVVQRNGRGKQNELVWKNTAWLKSGDEIVVIKNVEHGCSYKFGAIKLSKVGDYKVTHMNEIELPKQSSPEIMEYLGFFVGDGWTRTQRGEVGFALPENLPERSRLIKLHKMIFESNKFRMDKEYVYFGSVNLARFIDSLGFGKGARNKTIPEWVFTLPKEERQAFVDGLMQSDGNIIENSMRYTSSSYELLRRLRLLSQTLDYRVGKIHWRKIAKGTKCAKRFLLKDTEGGYVCFSLKKGFKNLDRYPSQSKYWDFFAGNKFFETEVVKTVKSCGTEPTLDLRVEDEHNFIANGIVVHNTGVQRSSATPYGAWTTTTPSGRASSGNARGKKPICQIIAAHGAKYVATASVAWPADLEAKVKKALSIKGPKFILVHSPCPPGWKFDSQRTIEIARLAVECGAFVLCEIENNDGKTKIAINRKPTGKSVVDYLKAQGRFSHLKESDIAEIEARIKRDWDAWENEAGHHEQ